MDISQKTKELEEQMAVAYSHHDIITCYEICNQIYELSTNSVLSTKSKYKLKGILQQKIGGLVPPLKEIQDTLNGLILISQSFATGK